LLSLSLGRVLRALSVTVALVLVVHVFLQLLRFDFVGKDVLRLVFDVDDETSLPTFLAAAILTACGALAWWLSRLERLPRPGWLVLALVFVLAGVDEVAAIHEELNEPLRDALDLEGRLRFAWVLVGGVVAAVVAGLFLRPFLALPGALRARLALGAALFLLGALGMETVGSRLYVPGGPQTSPYLLVAAAEEALEFAGALVWLGALGGRLRDLASPPTLTLEG